MSILLALSACNGPDTTSADTGLVPNADSGAPDSDSAEVTPDAATIYDLQNGTVAPDSWVTVSGVTVTGVVEDRGLFVQESGTAEYGGIWVYTGTGAEAFAIGQAVEVTGWFEEYGGTDDEPWEDTLSEINVGEHAGTSSVTDGGDGDVIEAVALEAADFQSAESYEGVLVTVSALTVTAGDDEFGEWAAGDVVVSSIAYEGGPVYVGDTFESVTGVLHYGYGNYKIVPRSEADLAGKTSQITRSSDITVGELVISELMIDPGADCDDTKDEYLELYNTGSRTLDLEGLTLTVGEEHTDSVASRVLVGPGEYAVLVRAMPSPCYGFEGDAALTVPLVNDGAVVAIANTGGVLDAVDTTGFDAVGASMSAATLDADENDDLGAWCASTTPLGTDFGTPGTANDCI